MAQLDDKQLVPPIAKSKEDAAKDIPAAVAYLKRTDNVDLAEQLGLSTYLEDEDEQETEDRDSPTSGGEQHSHSAHHDRPGQRTDEETGQGIRRNVEEPHDLPEDA